MIFRETDDLSRFVGKIGGGKNEEAGKLPPAAGGYAEFLAAGDGGEVKKVKEFDK